MQLDVAAMSWHDLKKYVYSEDGYLPDILVLGTDRDDWQRWIDFVNAHYRVVFRDESGREHDQVDFAVLVRYWDSKGEGELHITNVFVGGLQVNCFFYSDDVIRNDLDTREVNSLLDHDHLVAYLIEVAKLLNKQVVLVAEGARVGANNELDTVPLLIINQDQVQAHIY